jgi:hypothetical protein
MNEDRDKEARIKRGFSKQAVEAPRSLVDLWIDMERSRKEHEAHVQNEAAARQAALDAFNAVKQSALADAREKAKAVHAEAQQKQIKAAFTFDRVAAEAIGLCDPWEVKQASRRVALGSFVAGLSEASGRAALDFWGRHQHRLVNNRTAILKKFGFMDFVHFAKLVRERRKHGDGNFWERNSSDWNDDFATINSGVAWAEWQDDWRSYVDFLVRRRPELVERLFRGLPAVLDEQTRRGHTYITGASGSGKTELIKTLVFASIASNELGGAVVIDPHGDMAEQLVRFKDFVGNDRLAYLSPSLSETHVPSINPFRLPKGVRAERYAEFVVAALEQSMGENVELSENMRLLLDRCAHALLTMGGKGLSDLHRFMNDERNGDLIAEAGKALDDDDADFFRREFLSNDLATSKRALERRLRPLITGNRELFDGETAFDLEALIDAQKIIVINASVGLLGEASAKAFGRFILAYLQGVAYRRAEQTRGERVPVHVFLDECQHFISPTLGAILRDARKYGVYLTLAQQVAGGEMRDPHLREAVRANTALKFGGQSANDAEAAKGLGVDANELRELKTGHFLVRMGARAAPWRLIVRMDLADEKRAMSADEWETTKAEQVRQYYRPRAAAKAKASASEKHAKEPKARTRKFPKV